MSIRARVITLATASVAIAVVVALVAAYFAVSSELSGQVDDSLRSQARTVSAAAKAGVTFDRSIKLPSDVRKLAVPPSGDSDLAAQRIDSHGVRVGAMPGQKIKLPVSATSRWIARSGNGSEITDISIAAGHYRVITVGTGASGAMMIGRNVDAADQLRANLRIVLGLLILAGIGIAGLLGLLVARSITHPIIDLTDAADEIARTHDLTRRIAIERNDEIGRLAENFNSMLVTIDESQSALENSVTAQRQLVADASHELRTPVAAVRTDIELMIEHPELDADERERILREANANLAELAELISDLIELARGDEPIGELEPLRLDQLAADSISRFQRLFPGRKFEIDLNPCVVNGRPDRVGRAINNLIDNANKYSPADSEIAVSVGRGIVAVMDRGPGVPPEDRAHVFDRFWRGPESRREAGSGLGLAIVRQVAESHGGSVVAEDQPGGGACFRLTLPEAA